MKPAVLTTHAPSPSPGCHVVRRGGWPLIAFVGLLLVGFVTGCQSWNPLGEGFQGPLSDIGSGMRKEDSNAEKGLGLSTKSREIERNLGYR